MVIAANKKKRKKKEKLSGSIKTLSSVDCCYGCGAPLQIQEVDAPGFVDPDTYELVWVAFRFEFMMNLIKLVNFFVIYTLSCYSKFAIGAF